MMQDRLMNRVRLGGYFRLFALATTIGLGISSAAAQNPPHPAKPSPRASAAKPGPAAQPAPTGQYYIEFRSRYSWDYGHTYLIHAQVGERLTADNVAGLSPHGDDATMWMLGHVIPVPADTGFTDGDLEDKYVNARYRVYMDKAEYDRVVAYIKEQQATTHTWTIGFNNCNEFIADVAHFMGLRIPQSNLIYPKVFVNNMREINTHPDAPDTLFADNEKERANPTRDGRAMINNGIYVKRNGVYEVDPNRLPETATSTPEPEPPPAPATTPTPAPRVIIGHVHVSNAPAGSVAASDSSRQ
jgi:hypothetical protein